MIVGLLEQSPCHAELVLDYRRSAGLFQVLTNGKIFNTIYFPVQKADPETADFGGAESPM
ncbi:MAG: hypothetical protein LBK53_02615 [Heliobacteriaceae bacterium]|nr:hypothetical protein [Heliobacteriaceae bacterium]